MQSQRTTLARFLRFCPALVLAALLCTVPFNMGGCAVDNPGSIASLVQGGAKGIHALSLSDKDEQDMGQSVAIAVTSRYGVYDSEKLNRYVTLVGMTVASASPRSDLRFYFAVLDSDEVNAFSGPAGYVMVTRGAVARCKDESELAGLLGHEIGHIVKKHGLQAVQAAETKDALVTAANADDRVAQFGRLSDTAADAVLKNGFGKPQEMEADSEGVKYAIAAGYDPNGYLHFLERIESGHGNHGEKLMGTHPGIAERIDRVNDQIAKSGKAGIGATLADRFAANVDVKP